MKNKKCKTNYLPDKWTYFIKFLLMVTLLLAPQQTYAAEKTLSAGETLTLTADATWDDLSSSATSESWAVITGPYDVIVTGTTDIQFVSFQNTGSISFANETIVKHCVFDGNAEITVGTTTTPLSTNIIIEASDFRNQTNTTALRVSSISGDSTGTFTIKRNTFFYSTPKVILLRNRNGCLFTENSVFNMALGNLIGANWNIAGGHTYSNNFLSFSSELAGEYKTLVVNAENPTILFNNNYCYYDYSNPHPFSTTGTGETGIDYYTNNILEVNFNFDGANIFNSNSRRAVEISYNIHIGSGSLCNAVGDFARQPFTIKNNTCYSTLAGNAGDGLLYLSEGGPSAGSIDIYNNIVTGSTDPGAAVNSLTGIQTITSSGCNTFYNVTTPYEDVSVGTSQCNDITEDPTFVDPSRNLLTWDIIQGGAGTKSSVTNSFATVNGYDETTKQQSSPPSGYVPENLIAWVRNGFTPTNIALQGTGRGGVDIGAVNFSAEKDFSITIDEPLITN